MLDQIKNLGKSTAIYSLGNISSKIVGLVLLPVFTNEAYLSVESYGLLGLFEAIVQTFVVIFGLGIHNGLFRWYFEDEEKQGRLLFTASVFVGLTAVVGLLVGYLLEEEFTQYIFEDSSFIPAFRWMIITSAFQMISVIPTTLMRLREDAKVFTVTSVIRLALTLILTLIFLIPLHMELEGIFIAQSAGHLLFLVIVLPYMWRQIDLGIDWRVPGVLIKYSFPIMLSSLLGILVQFVDRFIINSFQGLAEVGIYSLAVKLSNVIKVFVISTMSLSLTPILFKKINEENHSRFYSKAMTYYGYGILLVIMFVSLFSYEFIKMFTGSVIYWDSVAIIPVISLSLYFVAIKSVGLMGLHISKKMWPLTLITVIVLSLNIALNFLLIPVLGTIGAAIATLSSQAVYFIIGYRIAQKQYFIPFEWEKISVMPVLAGVLIYCGIYTNDWNLIIRIPAKMMMIALFPTLLYFGGFYEEIEIQRLKGFYTKWRHPELWWQNIKKFIDQN